MTLELLIAIAQLCLATGHASRNFGESGSVETGKEAHYRQLACQKEYIKCVQQSSNQQKASVLAQCVLDKK